jgi:beta-lactam-binding protein with PASTA domain
VAESVQASATVRSPAPRWLPWLAKLTAVAVFAIAAGVTAWVSLVYTVHLGTVSVPEFRGRPALEAQEAAHDLGLTLEVDVPGVFHPDIPPGDIAYQSPLPGFHLKAGSTVSVRLSMGTERLLVPPVIGQPPQAALQELERAGFAPGARAEISGLSGADAVAATNPPTGTHAQPGQRVDILVNRPGDSRRWVTPNLESRRLEVVRRFAADHRIRIGHVHTVEYPGLPAGVVLRQYPPPGSPLTRSDILTLWVSR